MQANIKGVAKERDSSLRVYEWGWKQSQSDQNIMKEILTESWIHKNISVHSLRRSIVKLTFIGSGTDLHHIRELPGNASCKTNEIHTHITTKGFDQIKNPLDNLDI